MVLNTQNKNSMTKSKLYVRQYGAYWENKEGQLHREDGYAVEDIFGTKYWLLNDIYYRREVKKHGFINYISNLVSYLKSRLSFWRS